MTYLGRGIESRPLFGGRERLREEDSMKGDGGGGLELELTDGDMSSSEPHRPLGTGCWINPA